jgi:ferric-dicitrate binding protein FerR (iron transport regulator)
VETIEGAATLSGRGRGVAAVAPLVAGAEIPAGAWIETPSAAEAGTAGRLALRLVAGASLRIDEGSRVRLHAGDLVELARGAVYLDSATDAGPFDVRTPLGTVRDIGTQFEVRMLGQDGGSLRVRVRRGEVSVLTPGLELAVLAGEELLLGADGSSLRAVITAHGDAWQWVLGLAPPFELEGRTVAELLDWVSRETGWQVRFADAEVERVARETTFAGAVTVRVAGAAATRLLPAAGLAAHLTEGSLVINRAPPPAH